MLDHPVSPDRGREEARLDAKGEDAIEDLGLEGGAQEAPKSAIPRPAGLPGEDRPGAVRVVAFPAKALRAERVRHAGDPQSRQRRSGPFRSPRGHIPDPNPESVGLYVSFAELVAMSMGRQDAHRTRLQTQRRRFREGVRLAPREAQPLSSHGMSIFHSRPARFRGEALAGLNDSEVFRHLEGSRGRVQSPFLDQNEQVVAATLGGVGEPLLDLEVLGISTKPAPGARIASGQARGAQSHPSTVDRGPGARSIFALSRVRAMDPLRPSGLGEFSGRNQRSALLRPVTARVEGSSMGILSRISKVLESNVNALVDRAEDPGKMLDQAIEDMKKGQREAREAIIEAKTQKRLLERKRDKALAEAEACEKRAIQSLEGGDEHQARKYLELKLAAEQRVNAEDAAIGEQDRQIEQLVIAERELEQRLAQLPARKAALVARKSAAQARGARVGAASKAKNSVAAAIDAFDRMEEKIIRAEVEAEVVAEEQGGTPELMLPSVTDADRALEDLKKQVRGELPARTSAPSDEDDLDAAVVEVVSEAAQPASSAVDDSLADLKAKLGG